MAHERAAGQTLVHEAMAARYSVQVMHDPPQYAWQAVCAAFDQTGLVEEYRLPLMADKSSLHYHVENFLQSIRGKARLNCPAETALASEAAVLRALEAVEAKRQLPVPAEDA